METIKNFFGFGENYEDDAEIYETETVTVTEPQEEVQVRQTTEKTSRTKQASKPPISLHSNAQMKITIHEPISYDESPLIVDDLRLRKAVILNFEQLNKETKRQIFDFVNGALYALDGKIQKVNRDIFILAPSNIEIEGLREELQEKGVFPW